jgi:dipeptidase E
MRLVLYSGGQTRKNYRLHRALLNLVGSKKRIKMAYLSCASDGAPVFFNRFCRRYRAFGATDFTCLNSDTSFSSRELKSALNSDIIYLAGGNTFYFLHHLRKSGLLSELKEYGKSGGILAGLSAGAIILTPTIEMAQIPKYDADENDVALKNLKALGLTQFEFSPHYTHSKKRHAELTAYAKTLRHPVIACEDGDGIVIDGAQIRFIGKPHVFD